MTRLWACLSIIVPCSALCFASCGGSDDPAPSSSNRGGDGDGDGDDGHGTITLRDGAIDVGRVVLTCGGEEDGTSCGSMGGLICMDQECVSSRCSDGFTDPAIEECDDANDTAGDGCEEDCMFTCSNSAMCDDGNSCNGAEICDAGDHTCKAGGPPADGAPCESSAVSDGECRSALCVPRGCGDRDVKGEEECDDGNGVSGDGCEPTCMFTCEADAECDDGNVCTGIESCDVVAHLCTAGSALVCAADDECHEAICDRVEGCQVKLIDADGDHHAPDTLACGDDCDDTRADVNPEQAELCDDVDHDCDGEEQPDGTPTWYLDCDADSFAAIDARTESQCDEPPAAECGGRWTTREPDRNDPSSFDCNDSSPDTHPSQASFFVDAAEGSGFDYNCDQDEEKRWTGTASATATCSTLIIGGGCGGAQGWVDAEPACGHSASYTQCVSSETSGGGASTNVIIPPGDGDGDGDGCGIRLCTCTRVTAKRYQECR